MSAGTIPVAFYAPLKSPRSPVPSGDRTMARLLLDALERAGFAPLVASEFTSREPAGDLPRQREIAEAGAAEAERVAADLAARPAGARPRLWFTYHCYYKAPDHLGPAISRRLGIPYVIAEGSRAPARAVGRWAIGHEAAEAALAAAARLFVLTERDRTLLTGDGHSGPSVASEGVRGRGHAHKLVPLPPFLRAAEWERPALPRRLPGPTRLVCAAMMRDGDKLASYRVLADALALLAAEDWVLDVAGDGPASDVVRPMFVPFGERVRFHGALAQPELRALLGRSDLLLWPAVNEAYGMVLLEAQAAGCPVVAGDFGGVSSAMAPGRTGLLTFPGDARAFADAVGSLIREPAKRDAMGRAAAAFASGERDIAVATAILHKTLSPLIERREAAA